MSLLDSLPGNARNFVNSSAFRYGDKTSFQIFLDKERNGYLPGNHDPRPYLDSLGLKDLTGLSVAVICPGNGGLMTEVLLRGAVESIGYESRHTFKKALDGVFALFARNNDYKGVALYHRWPNEADIASRFDVIIWPEGFDTTVYPRETFESVTRMLKPSGVLYVEVRHGGNTSLPIKINNYTPTAETFQRFVSYVAPGIGLEEVAPGRMDRRVIYKLESDLVVVVDDEEVEVSHDEPVINKEPIKKTSSRSNAVPKRKAKGKSSRAKSAAAKIADLKRKKQAQGAAPKD